VSIADFMSQSSPGLVRVRSPQAGELCLALSPHAHVSTTEPGVLEVQGMSSEEIGERAAQNGLVLYELAPLQVSLEDAFMRLTRDEVEYTNSTPTAIEPERIAA
jgi:ABC-2 type transport system ATP-binding protein